MGIITFSNWTESLPCKLKDFIKFDNLSFSLISDKNISFSVDSKWKERLPQPSSSLDVIFPYTRPSEKGPKVSREDELEKSTDACHIFNDYPFGILKSAFKSKQEEDSQVTVTKASSGEDLLLQLWIYSLKKRHSSLLSVNQLQKETFHIISLHPRRHHKEEI